MPWNRSSSTNAANPDWAGAGLSVATDTLTSNGHPRAQSVLFQCAGALGAREWARCLLMQAAVVSTETYRNGLHAPSGLRTAIPLRRDEGNLTKPMRNEPTGRTPRAAARMERGDIRADLCPNDQDPDFGRSGRSKSRHGLQ